MDGANTSTGDDNGESGIGGGRTKYVIGDVNVRVAVER